VVEVEDMLTGRAGGLDRFDTPTRWQVPVGIDTPEVRVRGDDKFGAGGVEQSASLVG
jgi:hypothetical protein